MKKIAILTAAAIIAASPSYAGNLLGSAEEADPFVAEDDDDGISPLIWVAGGALIIGAILLASDSGSSSTGTAPQN